MNSRITAKERNLIKGALRRVFARSELRRQVAIAASISGHVDLTRPRVKNWSRCDTCKQPTPRSYIQVDHVQPLIPIDTAFEDMSLDVFLDRLWCDPSNLRPICIDCHKIKSKEENKARRAKKKLDKQFKP